MPKSGIQVIGYPGTGSAIAEAFLTLGGMDFERVDVNYEVKGPEKDFLLSHNPLGELPTLLLPGGEVLTETLAIANYVHARHPEAGLIPNGETSRFWRWIVFIVSAIYPTFTYGDDPKEWIRAQEGARELRESTDKWRKFLWKQMEAAASGPYFLGKEFSAIDVYLCAMTHWRPRRQWFETECPNLIAIARQVDQHPELQEVWKHHVRN